MALGFLNVIATPILTARGHCFQPFSILLYIYKTIDIPLPILHVTYWTCYIHPVFSYSLELYHLCLVSHFRYNFYVFDMIFRINNYYFHISFDSFIFNKFPNTLNVDKNVRNQKAKIYCFSLNVDIECENLLMQHTPKHVLNLEKRKNNFNYEWD